jgi:hypothetical protein
MKPSLVLLVLTASTSLAADPLERGEAVSLDRAVPANERGIACLAVGKDAVYAGTTGRAAHLVGFAPNTGEVRSLVRLDGGIGFANQLLVMPDGSLIGGTQADPTGIAVRTDPKAVGHLYRFRKDTGAADDLGVPVPGQGIYALAFEPTTQTVIGLTWPDGHLFTHDLKTGKQKDHGAIAGYRTFETPRHAEDLNRGTGENVRYSRQVSRAIVVHRGTAYTGGADGLLYRFDFASGKPEKLTVRLPAARGRESWASLDAAVVVGESIVGGTSDGYLFELRFGGPTPTVRSFGKPLAQGNIQGLVAVNGTIHGIGGEPTGVPRSFTLKLDPFSLEPGMLVHAGSSPCWDGLGAMAALADGTILAGERDRIGRLVRFGKPPVKDKPTSRRPAAKSLSAKVELPPLDFRVVFAPAGTTTDGSGYTALEVGKDDKVYVGAARYGGYAWLLRFDPASKPVFMDKVVSLRDLTGEDRSGINTQGKIHAKILVGADGRVWFASKQAHEVFDTRPEYGDDRDGFPGGHLCYFDPRTGFSRSLGIPVKQEGLMGGAIDDARGRLYYRSEPKNHFLVYDLKANRWRDRGNVGAMGRYMAVDVGGAIYTVGRDGYLCRYDPANDYVEDLRIEVQGEGDYVPPYVIAMGPNNKLYGLAGGHPSVMEFDTDKIRSGPFPTITMRNVAPAAPAGLSADDIHAGVFGHDGRLYFPVNTTDPATHKPLLIIMRFDPKTSKSEPVGVPRVIDFDESKVKAAYTRDAKFELRYMQGAAVGADGSLYLMGIYPQLHVACFPRLTAK